MQQARECYRMSSSKGNMSPRIPDCLHHNPWVYEILMQEVESLSRCIHGSHLLEGCWDRAESSSDISTWIQLFLRSNCLFVYEFLKNLKMNFWKILRVLSKYIGIYSMITWQGKKGSITHGDLVLIKMCNNWFGGKMLMVRGQVVKVRNEEKPRQRQTAKVEISTKKSCYQAGNHGIQVYK